MEIKSSKGILGHIAIGVAICALAACTAAQQAEFKTIVDTTGGVCEVVLQAVDPALAPLCVTAEQIADAIAAIVASHAAQADGGAVGSAPAYKPSSQEVYQYLVQHGAKAPQH